MLLPRLLNSSDPVVESEGTVNPLSLSPICDRLPTASSDGAHAPDRFVTAMCAAARVCADDEDDDVASGLEFEWFVYRVVMGRERWFQVVMGETYAQDELSVERAAERVPLPPLVSRELTMYLDVVGRDRDA
jgi:hypothetical protein